VKGNKAFQKEACKRTQKSNRAGVRRNTSQSKTGLLSREEKKGKKEVNESSSTSQSVRK